MSDPGKTLTTWRDAILLSKPGKTLTTWRDSLLSRKKNPHPVTDALIGTHALVYLCSCMLPHYTGINLIGLLMKDNAKIMAGQWWRLATASFCHSGLLHLLMNSISMQSLGSNLEMKLGHERFAQVYTAGCVGGSLLSFCLCPMNAIGASGGIFGLCAAHMALNEERRQHALGEQARAFLIGTPVWSLNGLSPVHVAVMLAVSFSPGIDGWCHLGGFLGGVLASSWLLQPQTQPVGPEFEYKDGVLEDRPPINNLGKKSEKAAWRNLNPSRGGDDFSVNSRLQSNFFNDK